MIRRVNARCWMLLLGLLFLNACTSPKDISIPSGIGGPAPNSYEGFTGLESVETLSASKVKLRWTRSEETRVIGYNIYDVSLMFSPRLLKTVPATSSDVTLTGLDTAALYSFRVRATEADQTEDENTNDLPAIPYGGIISAEVRDSTSATVFFNDASNADEAIVYCSTIANPVETELAVVTDIAKTQVILTNLEAGTLYSCRVALMISGVVDNNTTKVSFVPMGTASQLVFSTQPASAAAGVNFPSQPVVTIKDVNGTVVASGPDSSAVVTLTVAASSPTLGMIRGTATVTAVKGIATFTGLNIQEAGAKILTATKADTSSLTNGSPSITGDSSPFTISAGSVDPAKSSIAISPAPATRAEGLVANGSASYSVIIKLADQYGNAIAGIKPTFSSTVVGDALTQPTQFTDPTGQATGSISSTIADMNVPYRSLTIASPTGLTSKTVEAPFIHGAATKLAFSVQPVNSPAGNLGMATVKIAIQDAQGNIVSTGAAASSSVSLAIASNLNSATLTGTTPVAAQNGIAVFSDLGIDKTQTGYKLLASSGSYTPAYSNSFNITAGTPQKIYIGGPASVLSGSCSTAVTIQLRDLGNNPANAVQNTPVIISGLGGAQMFSSSACGGSALSTTQTFTAGTNTKTVYLKNVKAESVNLTATDTSAVLAQGSLNVKFNPNKMSLLAQSLLGGPLSVVSGQCSTALVVTTLGENGVAGPVFTPTTITFTGLSATSQIFYDSSCQNVVDPNNALLPASIANNYNTSFYLKDPKAEVLGVSIIDTTAVITTMSVPQSVTVLPSKITFTGPSSVVSGLCSSAFTVTLKDALNNSVVAASATALNINGLSSSIDGQFYTNSSCSGAGTNSSITIPQNSALIQLYFKDSHAETLALSISDPSSVITTSSTLTVGISPSALQIVGPGVGSAKSSDCAGPFTLRTLDGGNQETVAITPVTVNLGGAGTAGGYFTEATCDPLNAISQVVFSTGQSAKTFYFKGQYPASLTLTATDAASVLSTGTLSFAITAALGWIGTRGTQVDESNNLIWFEPGVVPVASRTDGARSVYALHFDSSKQYLYASDPNGHRVVKYDYTNHKYIGWIGRFENTGQIGILGSNLTVPSSAACVSTTSGTQTPGWCVGGPSISDGNSGTGKMNYPHGITDDGTYLYVVQKNNHSVTRYDATTGAFAGWIGRIFTTPTGAAVGGPASCTTPGNTVTPGWCTGGDDMDDPINGNGDGSMRYPRGIAYYNGSIFVGRQGAILKFNAMDGSFQGWVGMVSTTPPTSGAAGCSTAANDTVTPGWCRGGTFKAVDARYNPGGVNDPTNLFVLGSTLYVIHTDSGGVVSRYDADTGAFLGKLSSLAYNWASPFSVTTDGTDLFFADYSRMIKTDTNGLVLGWVGKVSNSSSMSGTNPGCATLVPNADTPGWCLGGTAKYGLEDGAFNQLTAIEYDGQGHLITGQGWTFPSMKMWDAATGNYMGTLAYKSTSPRQWTNDSSSFAQLYGFDDFSMFSPAQSYINNGYLYQAEAGSGRVKKIKLETGALEGWIGGITTVPTGGAAGCTSVSPMSASPGWCLGAMFNPDYLWNSMIGQAQDGIFRQPTGITGDGTYLYVTDFALHRIQKFNMSTGAYVGWIGLINTSPIGGGIGCAGAAAGTFTPGWCTGGYSQSGSGDGALNGPTSITYVAATGSLYVVDNRNHRISSYNATTGAFNGWIGRIGGTNPTSGCTYGSNGSYNVSQSGWCKGGTSQSSVQGDRGGGFAFWDNRSGGITSDGTYLYVANFYNYRIDKISFAGAYLGSVNSRHEGGFSSYTQTWTNSGATLSTWANWSCSYPMSIWAEGTTLYGSSWNTCWSNGSAGGPAVWKLNLTSGAMVGWQGAIFSGNSPTAGESGCAGATFITPGWCQFGGATYGYKMGQYSGILWISADSNFIYATDENSQRLTRLPK